METCGTNLSDLKRKKFYDDRTHEILNHWKRNFKMSRVEKEEEPGEKKLWSWKKCKQKAIKKAFI